MCGVFGIINIDYGEKRKEDLAAAFDVFRALLTMQHRGQDAAGILSFSFSENRFSQHKNLGLVESVFSESDLFGLRGEVAIGHTRYATSGSDKASDVQPLVTGFPIGVGMAHNGNIVNYHKVLRKIKSESKRQFLTHNDLEVILNLWCDSFSNEKNLSDTVFEKMIKASEKIFKDVVGGYGVVGINAEEGLFGFRDPKGIRPLILGEKVEGDKKSYALSSESLSLEFLGFKIIRDLHPGELLFIDRTGEVFSHQYKEQNKPISPCMFEWVYFSAVESHFEGKPVYGVRRSLGESLGTRVQKLIDSGQISPDIVCPVPDTSRSAAIALAESLRISYREGLIKNRYVQRSFILKDQKDREKAIELKLNPVRSEIEGKNILLVDDSIVRGTTSNRIVKLLKKFGAKEITLAVTCPPIRSGCFYGVDFPNKEELIAFEKTEEEIEEIIGVDKVVYLDEKDLVEAIDLPELCRACVSGNYPTDIQDGVEFVEKRNTYK